MGTWTPYKGLDVPSAPTGDAGINLKDDIKDLADRAPNLSTSDPAATDDSGDGYFAGSLWFNKTSEEMFVCVDATATAAVWRTLYERTSTGLILCPGDSSGQRNIQLVIGGDTRGTDSVDFQADRDFSNQVAKGNWSVICGGQNNRADAESSAIGGGSGNEVREKWGAVGGGLRNQARQRFGWVGGGEKNETNAYFATIGGGRLNFADGEKSVISGGEEALADKYGQNAHASGKFSTEGDAQASRFILRNQTTNDTQTELFLDGSAAAERMTIASDTTWVFSILIVARRTDADGESAAYKIEGCIDNNAGTTAFVGTPTVTIIAEDTAAWDAQVTADNTNDALVINVTGEASKTINWVARVVTTEVTG